MPLIPRYLYWDANKGLNPTHNQNGTVQRWSNNSAPLLNASSLAVPTSFQVALFVYNKADPYIDSGQVPYYCQPGEEADVKKCALGDRAVRQACAWTFVK